MMTLEPKPLGELSDWMIAMEAKNKETIADLEAREPGFLQRMKLKLLQIEARDGKLSLEDIFQAPTRDECLEYEPDHRIKWAPFFGYGRYSPNQAYHLAWGKGGDERRHRVAVSAGDDLILWLEPSIRVVDGWIADNGFFVLKAHLNDGVCFVFVDSSGNVFHALMRDWRCLKFIRFDADGMGFVYSDDKSRHEVRFETE